VAHVLLVIPDVALLARDFATISVMGGLDPAIHVFAGAIPGSRAACTSLVRGWN
jgi:hypothetical protein